MKFNDYSMKEIITPILLPDEISLYPIYAMIPSIQINDRFDSSNVAYVTYTNFDRLIIIKLESLTLKQGEIESYQLSSAIKKTHEIKNFGIYSAFLKFQSDDDIVRFNIEASPKTYKGAFPHQTENVKSLFGLFNDNFDPTELVDFFDYPEFEEEQEDEDYDSYDDYSYSDDNDYDRKYYYYAEYNAQDTDNYDDVNNY